MTRKNGSAHWNNNLDSRDAIIGIKVRHKCSFLGPCTLLTELISNCIRHIYLSTPFSLFFPNVELVCYRYRCMSFPFVDELISVLVFKTLRATATIGDLTLPDERVP